MDPPISPDEDVDDYFGEIATALGRHFGYPISHSEALVREYYGKFTDPAFCRTIGFQVHDDELFFHEGGFEMVLSIHYYLVLKGDPSREAYLRWRREYVSAYLGA